MRSIITNRPLLEFASCILISSCLESPHMLERNGFFAGAVFRVLSPLVTGLLHSLAGTNYVITKKHSNMQHRINHN